MVEGLTPEIRAQYNAAGLARLLASCPRIDGVQFRMNYESGVAEDRQAEYYEPQFRAIAECGRPIRLDLRAKGLTDDTIELAQKLVPDTVISTKHWCEHLGMPYPMPAIQQFDQKNYRRYGTLGSAAQTSLLCADSSPVECGKSARAPVGRSRMGAALYWLLHLWWRWL